MILKKNFFFNWLKDNWNCLTDIISFERYSEIKKAYLAQINYESDLSSLDKEKMIIPVENNFVLLIIEKWLYRQASIHEPDLKQYFRNHIEARTALINKYLFDKDSGLFFDYDLLSDSRVERYKPLNQFYSYWCNFSKNKEKALETLKKIKKLNVHGFVIFMGLRRIGLFDEANKIGKKLGFALDDYFPRVSTNTCSLLRYYSPCQSLDLIREAGFDTFDYSMDYIDSFFTDDDYLLNAKNLRKYADRLGLRCNQTHSVFPVWHKSFKQDEVEKRTTYTNRILEISNILGAKNCVVHPINDFSEMQNYSFYQQFLPLAHKLGINIATENMYNCDENSKPILAACSNHNNYKVLLDLVNDDHFVACVDLGHAEMDGLNTSAVKMIESLGKYVKCLHIHDNDLCFDRHGLPLSESIDFDLILDSLARIDYRGDITFECDGFINRMPKELHLDCLKLMYKIGLYLRNELLIRRKAICLKK